MFKCYVTRKGKRSNFKSYVNCVCSSIALIVQGTKCCKHWEPNILSGQHTSISYQGGAYELLSI